MAKKKYMFIGAYIAQPDEVLGEFGLAVRAVTLRNEAMDELLEAFHEKSILLEEFVDGHWTQKGESRKHKEAVRKNQDRINRLQAIIARNNVLIEEHHKATAQ
jgi:hypothetical protein